jgi:hypothetical protein
LPQVGEWELTTQGLVGAQGQLIPVTERVMPAFVPRCALVPIFTTVPRGNVGKVVFISGPT